MVYLIPMKNNFHKRNSLFLLGYVYFITISWYKVLNCNSIAVLPKRHFKCHVGLYKSILLFIIYHHLINNDDGVRIRKTVVDSHHVVSSNRGKKIKGPH